MKDWSLKEVMKGYGKHLISEKEGAWLMEIVDKDLKGKKKSLRKRRIVLEHMLRHWLGEKDVVRHF